MKTYLRIFALVLLAHFFLVTAALAGDPIPGVDVALTNTSTGMVVHTKTDDNGAFDASLAPGTYTVSISYADCAKACAAQASQAGGKAPATADSRSYTAGKFMLDIDGMDGITVSDVSPRGIRESPTLSSTGSTVRESPTLSSGVMVRESPSKASLGRTMNGSMNGPITITKEWTNSSPGCQVIVSSDNGKKEFKGHITLMK